MFKFIRVVILLAILFVVASNTMLSKSRATDWDRTLYVSIYPILALGNTNSESGRYLQQLKPRTYKAIETYFSRELKRYGKDVERPVVITVHSRLKSTPPMVADGAGRFAIAIWSLKLRYWAWRASSNSDGTPGDVQIFINYHAASGHKLLERSTALAKGQIGIVNVRASRSKNAMNNVIITHEILHTLGASDKYNLTTGQPDDPDGLADPNRKPRYPQRNAEIMAARVAISKTRWKNPDNIGQTIIGEITAQEIGLLK